MMTRFAGSTLVEGQQAGLRVSVVEWPWTQSADTISFGRLQRKETKDVPAPAPLGAQSVALDLAGITVFRDIMFFARPGN